MYILSVEKAFDAAHYLRSYRGRCERLHGHRFRVVVRIKAEKLDRKGMAYDFTLLKKKLAVVLEKYDHRCLNDIEPFSKINPSSENIAATIYQEIRKSLPGAVVLDCVEVWESPEACATYRPA